MSNMLNRSDRSVMSDESYESDGSDWSDGFDVSKASVVYVKVLILIRVDLTWKKIKISCWLEFGLFLAPTLEEL